MRNKHEQAQALLDGLDQVDEGMLQQALNTDTREKFRALGKLKQLKTSSERPVSVLRRWGAVAACLAVILALAASPWFFSSLLPVITPTEPTVPPTTTEPSEPEAPTPNLYISSGDKSIRAYRATGNWNYVWFDGAGTTELLETNRMPWLTTEAFAFLEFDAEPDSFEVQCWSADQEINSRGEEVTTADGMLHLKEGSYVYELTAQWYNHGRITYVFAVTASFVDSGYEFSSESGEYLWPSMLYDKVSKNALKATADSGTFYCFTDSHRDATTFIDAQMELLNLLQTYGMETKALTYYATDYDDSYSRSGESEAYIALSAVQTWRQVLVTLQAIWGDYTNYGYVYAVANTIAEALGWQTDPVSDISEDAFASFFPQNPDAILLEYPSFTTVYASEETVQHCKALSRFILKGNFELHTLEKPISEQLDHWHKVRKHYARLYDIPVKSNIHGYAYCSARIPLKIKVENAEFYIDAGYVDDNGLFLDAFSNYAAIYETTSILYQDILTSKIYWNPDGNSSTVPIYFISEETAKKRFSERFTVRYVEPQYGEAVYTRYLSLYMYGYYKHIVYQWNPNLGQAWQAQAFCELGRSKTWFAQKVYEATFTTNAEKAELFYAFTGRNYEIGRSDFFEMMDISCFINEEYTPRYTPVDAAASIGWYLVQHYGEQNIHQLLLFPDQCQSITEKNWDELIDEWAQYIKDKYADVVLPENIGS